MLSMARSEPDMGYRSNQGMHQVDHNWVRTSNSLPFKMNLIPRFV